MTRLDQSRRVHIERNRPGIGESISNSRSTLLINLIIEIVSGLVFFVAIGYTVWFLSLRRDQLDPANFKLYIEILIFFSLAWLTYIGFKIRAKYLHLRRNWSPDDRGCETPEE
jgi:hypothetical protein